MFHCVCVCAKSLQLCLTLCDPMDCTPPGSSVHGDSPGKNTGVDCHALLQGDLPDLGIQPESLVFHCVQFSSVTQSCPTLRSHGLQLPCPSPSPQVCSNSCPSSQRWHPTISSSVIAVTMGVQISPWNPAFGSFGYISGCGIAGLCVNSTFHFWGNATLFPTVLHRGTFLPAARKDDNFSTCL